MRQWGQGEPNRLALLVFLHRLAHYGSVANDGVAGCRTPQKK